MNLIGDLIKSKIPSLSSVTFVNSNSSSYSSSISRSIEADSPILSDSSVRLLRIVSTSLITSILTASAESTVTASIATLSVVGFVASAASFTLLVRNASYSFNFDFNFIIIVFCLLYFICG